MSELLYFYILIFSSETLLTNMNQTWQVMVLSLVPMLNCIPLVQTLFKMATITKNKQFWKIDQSTFISRNCLPFRSTWVFSGVRVTQSLVLCVCFVDHCLSFCPFSFSHCVVCPSSIYRFWLPLWYLQIFLIWSENQLRFYM